MKVVIMAMSLAAAAILLIPIGSAEAAMYVDSEERRNTMFGALLFMSALVGVLGILSAIMARSPAPIAPEAELSSEIVPQIKQESNIVQHIITA